MIASAVGGIQDQIVDRRDGLLIADPTDLDEFAGALVTLLDDPDLAARLGAAAHQRVLDEYLGDRHLTQYVDLFDEPHRGSGRPRLITISGPVAVGRTLAGPAPVINPGTCGPQPRALTARAITNSEVMSAAVACTPMRSTSRGQGGEMVLGGGRPAEAAAAAFN